MKQGIIIILLLGLIGCNNSSSSETELCCVIHQVENNQDNLYVYSDVSENMCIHYAEALTHESTTAIIIGYGEIEECGEMACSEYWDSFYGDGYYDDCDWYNE